MFKEWDKVIKTLIAQGRELDREERFIKEIDWFTIYITDWQEWTIEDDREEWITYNLQWVEKELFIPWMFSKIDLIK